jgi:tRNA G18 (ribose-2'-O)-methylase SpoU
MLAAEATRDRPDSFHREDTQGAKNSWKEERGRSLAVLLDNIRSAWNVGSILRSADGFGFAHAYLCGITPTPDGPGREALKKTSLGAEDAVAWSYHKDAVALVKSLKETGCRIFALEEDERAVPLESDGLPSGMREQAPVLQILIVGNEVTGVDPELLDLCDTIHCIPMRGQKRSFNVAIAFGIAAYALR